MLSNLDDYPIHQTSEPMRHAATSDRNFYDRYYFNGFSKAGDLMFVVGLGVYPNLGVMDAFFLVHRKGQHRVVRASRALDGADRLHPSVGPLAVEVLEPLKRLRVTCEPNEWGLAIDAVWTGAHEPLEEPRHYIRENGRVIFDSQRLAQVGGWDGTITVGDETITLTDATVWGTRDRSWGIRPVGESEPAGIRASNPFSWFWLYTPIRFDDHVILVIDQERRDGSKVMDEAVRFRAGTSEPEFLGHASHRLTFAPGTRHATGGVVLAGDIELTVEPLLPVHIGIGTGYGYDAEWRHGMWQGPLVVQGVHIDTTAPEGRAKMWGICDAAARFTYTDATGTHVGYGLFETLVVGPHDQYGFRDLLDGYEPAT